MSGFSMDFHGDFMDFHGEFHAAITGLFVASDGAGLFFVTGV